MIALTCPYCESRVWLISKLTIKEVACPMCHRNFSLGSARASEQSGPWSFRDILSQLPLTDVGSREKELILTESDLAVLGQAVLNQILAVEQWELSNKKDLKYIADRVGEVIGLMEERGQDTKILRLEYDLLNAFIRNFFD